MVPGCVLQRVQESLISRPLACAESLTSLRLSLAARATSSSLPVHCAAADMTIETRFCIKLAYSSAVADEWHAADLDSLPDFNISLVNISKAVMQK